MNDVLTANLRDDELLRHLDASPPAWVVTRTRRLARELTLAVVSRRAAAGIRVADTPPIRCLDDWIEDLGARVLAGEVTRGEAGDASRTGRLLLPASAEQALWERVITTLPGDQQLQFLDRPALAASAAEAWGRICRWGEPPWTQPLAEDVEAFRTWIVEFRRQLEASSLVTAAELPALVAAAIANGDLEDVRPAVVFVLGFERKTPDLAALLAALKERGSDVRENGGAARDAATPVVRRAPNPAAEIRSVAAEIRERLLGDPGLRIAVLAPDPSAYGTRLERIFEEELDPHGVLDVGGTSARRFDYAEAPSLADYPLIAGALDLLGLDDGGVSFETASRILLGEHPRRGGATGERERVKRGAVEAGLRRSRAALLHVAGRRASLAAEAGAAGLDHLAAAFAKLGERLAADRGARRSPSAWRREWIARLDILEWPGPIAGETEGLLFRRWRDAMDEFARLESVEGSMDAHHARMRLASICAATRVQPSSEGCAVQIMNLLDAAGLAYDVVYAIGMTATAFPAAPRPNPLLPVRWQREQAGMPRASVEGERELAEQVWARLLRSAPEVFVSWPALGDGDEDNTPTSFVSGIEPETTDPRRGEPWWLEPPRRGEGRGPRPADVAVPALVRRGDSSLLTKQSLCPFRAFAAARLGAERLGEVQPQPDPSQRGTLVHTALASVYGEIRLSSDLAGLSDENVAEAAAAAAREAVKTHAAFFEDAGDLADAARLWLGEMVAAWMRHERDARRGDWSVEALETDDEMEIGPDGAGLRVRLRPDRVDRVADGGLVILDFKTSGAPKGPGLWRGDRPEDAQLPLYLTLFEKEGRRVDGIAFANLSARDTCLLAGQGADEFSDKFTPPGRKGKRGRSDWEAASASMRATVETLAAAYLAGDARVDPKKGSTCRNCGGYALCRVREIGVDGGDDDEEGGE